MNAEHEVRPPLDLTRPMIESEIERLISILDWLDPDPDFEDQGDLEPTEDTEPLYGWTDMQARFNRAYGPYTDIDADGCELDEADAEPELGSLEQVNQLHWSRGRDAEPSLGSLSSSYSQEQWSDGGTKDFEEEHDGREPCCEDEGAQCDDEGCVDEDNPGAPQWGGWRPEEQEATTRACVGAISRVRHLQQRSGRKPIEPLRVLGGAIIK